MKKKILVIADYFIAKNNLEHKGLSNKKLQKLLYYSQAWYLVFKNQKMFSDDIEAWIHGPAISFVYAKFKQFGANDINIEVDTNEFKSLSTDEKALLDAVWSVYGKYDGNYLEVLTHSEEPWLEARKELSPIESSNKIIDTALMRSYYARLQEQA